MSESTRTRRITPGRTAKAGKRKLSEERETRAVKQKVAAAPKVAMAFTVEQLRAELNAQEERIS